MSDPKNTPSQSPKAPTDDLAAIQQKMKEGYHYRQAVQLVRGKKGNVPFTGDNNG